MDVDLGRLRARSQNYDLLAQLLCTGFDAKLVPILRFSPRYQRSLEGREVEELEELHEHLFDEDFSIFSGVFLNPEGRISGPLVGRLRQNLVSIDALPTDREIEPDSLIEQVALLARLVGCEVEGWENERPEEWQSFHRAQGLILHQHLMPWLPPWTVALILQDQAPYRVLAEELWHCAFTHFSELHPGCGIDERPFPVGDHGVALLHQPAMGNSQVAEYLVRPFYSGWYLSRSDLLKLAEVVNVSLPLGVRQSMMLELLNAADRTHLVSALMQKVRLWEQGYDDLRAPQQVSTWRERLAVTRRLVDALHLRT